MEQTGDKFNDLYVVSKKIDFLRPKVGKTSNELEYEKSKNECTFQPKINKQKNESSSNLNAIPNAMLST